jgi:ATP-binding cassette subfamily F protein uup
MLARALSTPSNLLILDEPTNDLDLETLDLLQENDHGLPGTVILSAKTATSSTAPSRLCLLRRERPLDGIRRRLFRHGGPSARAEHHGRAGAAAPKRRRAKPAASAPIRKLSFKREARAGDALPRRIETMQARSRAASPQAADPPVRPRPTASIAAADLENDERIAARGGWLP